VRRVCEEVLEDGIAIYGSRERLRKLLKERES
jgi:hypothetical protein